MKVRKKTYLYYSIVFIILTAFGSKPFIDNKITTIWNADAAGQYYPAFLYIGQYVRNIFLNISKGIFSFPVYDLSIGMGENIIGCLNYYGFGDPFNVLAVFATKENGPIVYAVVYLVRLYLGGISALIYCKEMSFHEIASVIGGISYTFCGFALYGGLMYIEWLSVLFFFPLILTGAERVIKDKKNTLFIFATAYGALCGFYFFYMSSIALAGYCFIRLLFNNGLTNIKNSLKTTGKLLGLYLVGIVVASPIFVFSVRAFLNSERNGNVIDIIRDVSLYKPSLGLIRDSFSCSVKVTKSYALGIGYVEWIIIFISMFFYNNRKRVQLKLGVIFSIILVSLPISYWFFNGFGANYSRWFFILQFFFMIVFVSALTDVISFSNSMDGILRIVSICTIGVVGVVVCVNVVRNIWMLMQPDGLNWQSEFILTQDIDKYSVSPVELFGSIVSDEDLFRVSNDTFLEAIGRPENTAMINNYNGLTYFFSIVNKNVKDYVELNNGYKMQERSYGFNNNLYTEALAGVKYFVSNKKDVVGYEFIEKNFFYGEEWYAYKNPYYCGFAYMMDSDYVDYSAEDGSLEDYNKHLYKKINNQAVKRIEYDKNANILNCNIDGTGGKLIIAMPYDSLWDAYVDGQKVTVYKSNMYIGIDVPYGEHDIKVVYSRKWYYMLIFVSLIAIGYAFVSGLRKD